mmetsp:Transcript_26177/g.38629  ORF Transcript_26177/g.38629 Transcript_26177/m.38629 type:complete len:150 (-) Transcript_26177:179-628(-)
MALSKKKKKSKLSSGNKTKPKKGSEDNRQNSTANFLPIIGETSKEEWVTLELKLLDWEFMDFRTTVRSDTHLFTIKDTLKRRHGQIRDLVICKNAFKENNEMQDDALTLKDYGITGNVEGTSPPVIALYYDFKTADCANPDPILLSWLH